MDSFDGKVSFVSGFLDLLRGLPPEDYRSVIPPLLVLRRLDAVLEPTTAAGLAVPSRSCPGCGASPPIP